MSKLNKIVTSQIESTTGAKHETNTYSYDSNGVLVRHDADRVGKLVVGPGVLYGANKDSAEQTGLNTIKLIPNEDLATDQFLIIEPTSPNHIHIRAGGTQDDSNAVLILGGERNAVLVGDDQRAVAIYTRQTRIENTYENVNEVNNDDFVVASGADIQVGYSAALSSGGGGYAVTSVTQNSPSDGFMTVVAAGLTFVSGESYTFSLEPNANNSWVFDSDGHINFPNGTSMQTEMDAGHLIISTAPSSINNGGNIELNAGYTLGENKSGGSVNITAGAAGAGSFGGSVYISTSDTGRILLAGDGGEFLNNMNNPANQIAILGDLPFILVPTPITSIGQDGDVPGRGAIDANYIYYCVDAYNGSNHIWKRVAWSNDTWTA